MHVDEDTINRKFQHRHYFADVKSSSPSMLAQVWFYISKNFNVKLPNVHSVVHENSNDADVYKFIRGVLAKNNITAESLREQEQKYYLEYQVPKKVRDIRSMVKEPHNFVVSKILDVGTEREEFLEVLSAAFEGAEARGINIGEGYFHYGDGERGDSRRIVTYDGVNFPFDKNSFDLITIIAVIHHISPTVLKTFLLNACKVCRSIYIKDHDIIDNDTLKLIQIQHDIYEGAVFPGGRSYINYAIKYNDVVDILREGGMKVVNNVQGEGFSRSFSLYAVKRDDAKI